MLQQYLELYAEEVLQTFDVLTDKDRGAVMKALKVLLRSDNDYYKCDKIFNKIEERT